MVPSGLLAFFAALPDPRVERARRHDLLDIVAIALGAVICGADTWVDIAEFGRSKESWLRTFWRLPNGIPSHHPFGRVFAALDPAAFERCGERRTTAGVSRERRHYLSSFPADPRKIAAAVRGHWGIENRLHWVLDIAFREDDSRVRSGFAAENLAVLRHLALNLLRRESTARIGVKAKRLKAGWDQAYLLAVLAA